MNVRKHGRATPARMMLSALEAGHESVAMETLPRADGYQDPRHNISNDWSMAYHARAHALKEAAAGTL